MSQVTIVGTIATGLGHFSDGHTFGKVPSTGYRRLQRLPIVCELDHQQPLGEVRYLELTPDRRLLALAEIDGTDLQGPLWFSPTVRHENGRDAQLLALSLTKTPASVGLRPVRAFPGPLHLAARQVIHQHGPAGEVVTRADEASRGHSLDRDLLIHDISEQRTLERNSRLPAEQRTNGTFRDPPGRAGTIEHRPVQGRSILRVY